MEFHHIRCPFLSVQTRSWCTCCPTCFWREQRPPPALWLGESSSCFIILTSWMPFTAKLITSSVRSGHLVWLIVNGCLTLKLCWWKFSVLETWVHSVCCTELMVSWGCEMWKFLLVLPSSPIFMQYIGTPPSGRNPTVFVLNISWTSRVILSPIRDWSRMA